MTDSVSKTAQGTVIQASGLNLTFDTNDGPVHALRDVNLEVGKGDFVIVTAASSSVGLAAFQIARMVGATVIATTRTGGGVVCITRIWIVDVCERSRCTGDAAGDRGAPPPPPCAARATPSSRHATSSVYRNSRNAAKTSGEGA